MAAECHSRSGFVFQRKLSVDFRGGEITGEAGLVLVREFDERLGLTQRLRKLVRDDRDRRYITHDVLGLLRQRIYQIDAGYEDANDATSLRNDPTMRAVVQRVESPLASQPTLSRLENDVDWGSIRLLENEGLQWFCGVGHGRRHPEEIILDVDSTEDPTHGQQALSFYNGHYDTYMYHPLFVFEGNTGVLLASCLRPGNVGGISHLLALVRPLIARLRARFSRSTIAIRADGDFAKPKLLDFAEYAGCLYAIGMPRNSVLEARVESLRKKAERRWEQSGGKPLRLYTSFFYKAKSWSCARRIVAKVEYTAVGYNPRFLVTNRRERAEEVFAWYSRRGQVENFIKDLKNEIAADRSPARPTGPTPFAFSSTPWPTISWCSSAGSCCAAPRSPQQPSARFGSTSSRSPLGCGARLVASGFTSPPDGLGNRSSSRSSIASPRFADRAEHSFSSTTSRRWQFSRTATQPLFSGITVTVFGCRLDASPRHSSSASDIATSSARAAASLPPSTGELMNHPG